MLTQVTEKRLMHFETSAKHGPVNSEKYAALLSILMREFENEFQDFCLQPVTLRKRITSKLHMSYFFGTVQVAQQNLLGNVGY